MTATTSERKVLEVSSPFVMRHEPVMVTGASILKGTLTCLTTAGLMGNPDTANARFCIGVAEETVSSAAAGRRAKARQGIFWLANGGSFTAADKGKICYAADNQTVDATDTNPVAGVIYDVDAVKGVAVKIDMFANLHLLPALAAGGILQGNSVGRPVALALGTANQIPKVNAGATALEYAADAT